MFLLVLFICFNIVAGVTGTGCPDVTDGTCTACSAGVCTDVECDTGFLPHDNACTKCGNKVELEFEMEDSYGDGWNGASIDVSQRGVQLKELTVTSGYSHTESVCVSGTEVVTILWVPGSYDSECSYSVTGNQVTLNGDVGDTHYYLDGVFCGDYFYNGGCVDLCPAGMGALGRVCETCPVGKFSSSDVCVSCPVGEYSLAGSTACRDISGFDPAAYRHRLNNRFSIANAASITCTTTGDTVPVCSAGSYKTGQTCTLCAAGTYSGIGASTCSNCTSIANAASVTCTDDTDSVPVCSPGYSKSGQTCTECAAGTYSIGTSCTNCVPGKYQDQKGQTSCKNCIGGGGTSGQYQDDYGATGCKHCSYTDVYSNGGADQCTLCTRIANTLTTFDVSCTTSSNQRPTKCKIGYEIEPINEKTCTACPVGKDIRGNSNGGYCSDCAAGRYGYELEGVSRCTDCPAGFSQSQTGNTSCSACLAGFSQSETGQSLCTSCGSGWAPPGSIACAESGVANYQYAGAAICDTQGTIQNPESPYECIPCQNGEYQDEFNKTVCKECDAGKFRGADPEGASRCQDCDAGSYQDQSGQSSCTACPTGFHSEAVATSCEDCPGSTDEWVSVISNKKIGENRINMGADKNLEQCKGLCTGYKTMSHGTEACLCGNSEMILNADPSHNYTTYKFQRGLGQFQGQLGQSICLTCPSGQYQDESGKGSCKGCTSSERENKDVVMKGMAQDVPGWDGTVYSGLTRAQACGTGNFPTTAEECAAALENSEYSVHGPVSVGSWSYEVSGCNVYHGGGTASRRTWQWNDVDEDSNSHRCDFAKSLGCVCTGTSELKGMSFEAFTHPTPEFRYGYVADEVFNDPGVDRTACGEGNYPTTREECQAAVNNSVYGTNIMNGDPVSVTISNQAAYPHGCYLYAASPHYASGIYRGTGIEGYWNGGNEYNSTYKGLCDMSQYYPAAGDIRRGNSLGCLCTAQRDLPTCAACEAGKSSSGDRNSCTSTSTD